MRKNEFYCTTVTNNLKSILQRENNNELFWEDLFDKLYTISDTPFVKKIEKTSFNTL